MKCKTVTYGVGHFLYEARRDHMKRILEKIFFVASISALILVGLKMLEGGNLGAITLEVSRYKDVPASFYFYVMCLIAVSFGYGWAMSKIRKTLIKSA